MKIEFAEPATREFYEAIAYYDIQRSGLGLEFAKQVEETIERIKQNPEAWTTISFSKHVRRCLTNRFPYGVIYQIGKDTIFILAVMHLRRRPQTWQSRLPKNHQ